MFDEADLIHRYTRADALRDGVLVDVTGTAKAASIRPEYFLDKPSPPAYR
jgi:hypothetical protein